MLSCSGCKEVVQGIFLLSRLCSRRPRRPATVRSRLLLLGGLREHLVHSDVRDGILFVRHVTRVLDARLLLGDVLVNLLKIDHGAHLGTTDQLVIGVRVLADCLLGGCDDLMAMLGAA